MKLCSFMRLGLIRCLRKERLCLRKTYSRYACLVISASTLLNILTVRLPISREALLKVSFASPVKSISVNVHLKGPVLMLWLSNVFALSSIVGEVDIVGSRVMIIRGGIIFDCVVLSIFDFLLKWSFQVDGWIQ